MNVFRLLVVTIIVVAIIYVLLNLLNVFVVQTNFIQEVTDELRKAEIILGRSQTKNLVIEKQLVKAETLENESRNIVFNCNDLKHCCPKSKLNELNKDCENDVAWNEKEILIKNAVKLDVTSRCFEDIISWCTVFIGRKPSEIKLKLEAPEKVKLGKDFNLKITTRNIGKDFSIEIQRKITVSKITHTETGTEKTKLFEKKLKNIRLGAEDELTESFQITMLYSGDIEIKINGFETNDRTDFDEKTITVEGVE